MVSSGIYGNCFEGWREEILMRRQMETETSTKRERERERESLYMYM